MSTFEPADFDIACFCSSDKECYFCQEERSESKKEIEENKDRIEHPELWPFTVHDDLPF